MPELRKQLSGKHHSKGVIINLIELIAKDRILQNKREIKVSCKAHQSLLLPSLGLKRRLSLVVPGKQAILVKTGAPDNLFIATFNSQIEGGFLTWIFKVWSIFRSSGRRSLLNKSVPELPWAQQDPQTHSNLTNCSISQKQTGLLGAGEKASRTHRRYMGSRARQERCPSVGRHSPGEALAGLSRRASCCEQSHSTATTQSAERGQCHCISPPNTAKSFPTYRTDFSLK